MTPIDELGIPVGMRWGWTWVGLMGLVACGGAQDTDPFGGGDGTSTTAAPGTTATGEVTSTGSGSTSADASTGDGPKLDLAIPDFNPPDPPMPSCNVVDDMDAVGSCDDEAPPDSFEPDVQWTWDGGTSSVTPLVANLTDDNDDGSIDLCDIPDVIVTTNRIHVLDGETGQEHFDMGPVSGSVTPAIGDLDGDGEPEIVSANNFLIGALAFVAFDTDGTMLWTTDAIWENDQGGAVGIADFDNDGTPEIYADGIILSSTGTVLFQAPPQVGWFIAQRNTATVAADLDGDDDLELILGQAAYHHDGTLYYRDESILPGYPQIANLDGDPEPEIIINNDGGITILEHDGTIKNQDMTPTGEPAGLGAWFRPSTVHDFDGDGVSEFAVSSAESYSVFEPNLVVNWSVGVQDGSGWAAGTAFDFLGDGVAEAMYADEATLFIYGADGAIELQVPRSSRTLIEYPVVADVDNDGSAEIVVVSGDNWDDNQTSPTVQVIRDVEDRWIQARRIWNQHTYHVTNVREDGTIPAVEPRSWQLLNTYRTNAQIENGSVCQPPPEG
ncbi:MAG: FG-GAP repeat domain-containing protein [Nannocystales bacterium]